MLTLLAIICPPLAVLFCGKPFSAILNLVLWCCFIIPGIIHAVIVVNNHKADKRTDKMIKGVTKGMVAVENVKANAGAGT